MRAGARPRQETRTAARWTTTVSSVADGLEIRTSNFELDPLVGSPTNERSGGAIAAHFAAASSLRVQATGELAAVEKQPMPEGQIEALLLHGWGILVATWLDVGHALGESVASKMSSRTPVARPPRRRSRRDVHLRGPGPLRVGRPATALAHGGTHDQRGRPDQPRADR